MSLLNSHVKFFFLAMIIFTQAAAAQTTFQGSISPIPPALKQRMEKYTWHPGCPVAIKQLALVKTSFWGFDQKPHQGELIVRASLAKQVLAIFHALYEAKYPIQSLTPIEYFQGDDLASMEANNSSAFNCRTNTSNNMEYSIHSYGRAIDLNPLMNPYVDGKIILPKTASAYLARDPKTPGLITHASAAYKIFHQYGWQWGGDWVHLKDYQHFQKR